MKTKLLSLIFFCLSIVTFAQSNEQLLDSANTAYSKNRFTASIGFYEQILSRGISSPEIYFNLGNARFKNKELALAVLNYERAKKLSPADDDINYNLKLVNNKLVDKIDALPHLFIKDWWNSALLFFSERTWSIVCISFVWIGLLCFVLYYLSDSRSLKKMGFTGGFTALAFAFVFFMLARKDNSLSLSHSQAIVLEQSVNIKGSPSEQGTNVFVLHEGTKVDIEQTNGDWSEIKLINGNRGWIKTVELAAI